MWDPIERFTDRQMASFANLRTRCLMADGSCATLVYWPFAGQRADSTRGRARVEYDNERRRTIHRGEIVAVWADVPVMS